jgi:hypothetical protein
MKRPSFQFYPADWRKDMALQSCSVAARGLWVDMLCIAHECEPYGHLTVNGRPMTPAQIGRHTGLTERECSRLVAELEDSGVLSRTDEGAIFSRRMVRDEDIRQRRAEGGKAGSEHGAKGAEHGAKGGRPRKDTGDKKPPLEPPPSSSSSSSSSSSPSGKNASPDGEDAAGAAGAPPADPPPPPATPAPPPPKTAEELTRTELWRAGKSLLREQDMPEAQCGTFVGKLVKDYGEAIVVEAVRSAVVQRPADAATWLVGACKAAKGGAGKPGQLTGDQQVAASLAKAQRVAAMGPLNGAPRPAAPPTELIDD